MNTNRKKTLRIAASGVVAALYVIFSLPFSQFSFGPIQFRLSEVLVILPCYSTSFVPGLGLGCFIANLINPGCLGAIDIIAGTFATLLSGVLTGIIGKKHKFLGVIPPIIINGLIVGSYLPFLLSSERAEITFPVVAISILSVTLSEAAVLILLGIPLMLTINKNTKLHGSLTRL